MSPFKFPRRCEFRGCRRGPSEQGRRSQSPHSCRFRVSGFEGSRCFLFRFRPFLKFEAFWKRSHRLGFWACYASSAASLCGLPGIIVHHLGTRDFPTVLVCISCSALGCHASAWSTLSGLPCIISCCRFGFVIPHLSVGFSFRIVSTAPEILKRYEAAGISLAKLKPSRAVNPRTWLMFST